MFLRVDKDKARRKGVVYIAQVGNKVVVGRSKNTTQLGVIINIATECAVKNKLPEITILKMKKVSDTYKAEAYLHSALYEYTDNNNYYKGVEKAEIDIAWKEMI